MLGTVQFGLDYGISNQQGQTSSNSVKEILSCCEENSLSFLDTAYAYGNSESVLGNSISDNMKFNIVTKIPKECENIFDTYQHSLNNLKCSSLYGLMFHDANDLLSAKGESNYDQLCKIKDDGLAKKIGTSLYNPEQLEIILDKFEIDLIQIPMNIFDQRFYKRGLLKKAKEKGIEIHLRSLFLQGLIFITPEKINPFFEPVKDNIESFHNYITENNLSPVEAAFSFIKSIKEIDKVIIGVNDVEQLRENISCFIEANHNLDQDFSIEQDKFIDPSKWELL